MKTLWILEDHAALRESLAAVFEEDAEVRCALSVGHAEPLLRKLRDPAVSRPDALLLDLGLPGMSGLEVIPQVRALSPETTILVLTVFEDEEKVFRAVCAGASGYLLKGSSLEEMIRGVREALAGGSPMTPRIARRVLEMFSQLRPNPRDYGLTEREREILRLVVVGLTKKELAARLELSVHTVDTHLRRIYEKLEVHNRSGAVAKALQDRLT